MTDSRRLKARMTLLGITPRALADAQGWKCTATAYRKINNRIPFTVPEVQVCKQILQLSAEEATQIFFCR